MFFCCLFFGSENKHLELISFATILPWYKDVATQPIVEFRDIKILINF